jgi:hypothetical protein
MSTTTFVQGNTQGAIQIVEWYQEYEDDERKSGRVQKEGVMIHLDLNAACNMVCTDLPEGWVIENPSGERGQPLGLLPPNAALQGFSTVDTTTADQVLKAIAAAKTSQLASPRAKACRTLPSTKQILRERLGPEQRRVACSWIVSAHALIWIKVRLY